MLQVALATITSFIITLIAIPSIIKVAEFKHLFDEPGSRTSHTSKIPTLGGLAIFAGFIFSISFWIEAASLPGLQYLMAAIIIIFFIGIKDDIIAIDPLKKFAVQLIASIILVYWGNFKLTSLYGIFGYYELLPEWASIALSVFTILVVMNSFNLIDGINGLSGSIGTVISLTFGVSFLLMNQYMDAILGFALAGALIAFLKYNYTPAKIFMGDTGSLLIGLVSSVLAIRFIELATRNSNDIGFLAAPTIAIGILIIPLMDTLRVFVVRLSKGKSPFSPDRRHIHHILIELGCSHMKATGILVLVNMLFIATVYSLQRLGSFNLLFIVIGLGIAFTGSLYLLKRRVVPV